MTMRDARNAYFAANSFGANGGYDEPWITVKFGPLPLTIPNTPTRVAAVRYHDLHHIVTGYSTDIVGEFEIAAWEIASGCRNFPFAWIINLAGLAGGLFVAPVKVFNAFMRGRRSDTLYGKNLEEILAQPIREMHTRMILRPESAAIGAGDLASFAAYGAASLPVGLAVLIGGSLLTPIVVAAGLMARLSNRKK